MNKPDKSRKLGEVVPNTAPFTFQKREPGWMPDMLDNSAGPGGADQRLFLDEAIGHEEKNNTITKYISFKLPGHPKPPALSPEEPFLEPFVDTANPGTADEWNAFNKWILGGSLDVKNEDKPNPFTEYLRELTVLCRHHNAALYSMRRMHYAMNAPMGSSPMEMNPNGYADDKKPVPSPTGSASDFNKAVKRAELRWDEATRNLRDFIRNGMKAGENHLKIIADMVEVNNYVVSMRVIAQSPNSALAAPNNGIGTKEYTGISSSHISLSSAFSSYTP